MTAKPHLYRVTVEWTGSRGRGTLNHASYDRDHLISAAPKPPIAGSADPAFRGDPARWNPEELLLASISACHKLWYLGLCANAGIAVLSYRDAAEATMLEDPTGSGRFVSAVLRPAITIRAGDDMAAAIRLHHAAHAHCFIANSVNFAITVDPIIRNE